MKEILTEIVVQPEDIDELGHMNYLRYLTYFEKGELDWFARIGVSEEYLITRDIGAVLRKFDVDYLKEARLGDSLKVRTELIHVGSRSFTFQQDMFNSENEQLTECKKTYVMFHLITRKALPVIKIISAQMTSK
ncbi:acyl-CoA thioesterase [Cytobacillus horneckiae]|uniref:acyl-CoA thioesterase n=1 Tax=Cytobacillus horneckiae TaxID=549687 RepID=UPI003D9A4FFE